MAYVNCHSYITGLDVQYPVIQVKLKHKVRDLDFGCSNANNSTAFWNTSPAYMATERFYYDENNHRWQTNGSYTKSTAGVTNRMTQRYDASGTLKATYDYIYRGTHPVISNKDFDVEDYEVGENIVDLFSTDMVMVKAYLYKLKLSEIYYNGNTPPSYTYYDVDNNAVSEPYVFAAVQIAMFLKSNGVEIGRYSFLQSDSVNGMLAPTRFAFSTEMFDIEGFNVNYLSYFSYYSNYNMFFTDSEKSSMKLYNGEEDVTGTVDHCVVPQFTLYASQGYTASRNNYAFYQFETIDNQGNSLSNAEVKNVAANAVWQYILDCFDNSDEFIDFNTQLTYYYRWYTSSQIQSKIDQYFATDRGYKVKSNGQTISAFTALSNCIVSASPVLIPITDANHAVTNYWNQLATYIPLTTDVQGGDPDPGPGPGPDPGPEETEEADDPETDYDPDESDGYDEYDYPSNDIIDGLEAGNLPYGNSYNNFVFGHFKISSINPQTQYDRYAAYQMIMDCTNTTLLEWVAQKFESHNFQLSDFISRVYETPFSYEDIFDETHPALSGAPSYGYMGPVTRGLLYTPDAQDPMGPGSGYKWDSNNIHYFNFSPYRYFPIDLGVQNIEKVFDNYLDYKCQYTLNLPYGGPQVDIDPNYLFGDSNKGTIRIKGIFDIDTGTMYIKVLVGPYSNNDEYLQLYYQTIVNVASDKIVSAVDAGVRTESSVKMGLAIAGAVGSIALGIGKGKFGNGDPYAGDSRGASERRARDLNAALIKDQRETEERALRAKERIREAAEKAHNSANERIRVNADRAERHREQVERNQQWRENYSNMRTAQHQWMKEQDHIIREQDKAADHARQMEKQAARDRAELMYESRKASEMLVALNHEDPEKAKPLVQKIFKDLGGIDV